MHKRSSRSVHVHEIVPGTKPCTKLAQAPAPAGLLNHKYLGYLYFTGNLLSYFLMF